MAREPSQQSKRGAVLLPGFGLIDPARVLAVDDWFAVVSDRYPVAPGHTLIIPRRALPSFQDLEAAERSRLMEWVAWTQQHLQSTLSPPPDAFNLGVNDGKAAGQTILQFHFHVISRQTGDVPDPRGGVRWVKTEKAKYW